MFRKLKIQNYILIDKVEISFSENMNVITGETGAGKSVLLGALALLSGHRADPSVLRDKTKKCIIEAEISLNNKQQQVFFEQNDLDFEKETVVRREINLNGKSRAFINDTPVVLKVLEQFSNLVFDLHTQDQNRLLKDEGFRLSLVDLVAETSQELSTYQTKLQAYQTLDSEVNRLIQSQKRFQEELDFIQFQFQQLDDANLVDNEQKLLEQELEKLMHAEEIKQGLSLAYSYISEEEQSVISLLIKAEQELSKISPYYKNAEDYLKRIQTNLIDLQDLAPDLEAEANDIEYSSSRIEAINERLNLLMNLQHKHQVDSVALLIGIRNSLDEKLLNFGNSNFQIEEQQKELAQAKKDLEKASSILTKKRTKAFSVIEQETINTISDLGIPKARFELNHILIDAFESLGQDEIKFMFSANKGTELDDLNKIASGGEVSRLMLALKKLQSRTSDLSTLILDEIDTGVSGEVADKMGKVMHGMSENRQLIVITHLPQIAAKGDSHFKVKKDDNSNSTITKVELLENKERLMEIAQLLSGENITEAAIGNAKELFN